MMQVTLGLLFVLALIAGLAWSLSRLRGIAPAAGSPVKVIGAAAVGTRERVVVVEVGGQWLVVGVASGGVTLLHKTEPMPSSGIATPELPKFAAWLQKAMKVNPR